MEYTREKLIKNFLNFFVKKNHKKIRNFSLIPENDPTVLFTTAGMHPLIPYLLGQPHSQGKKLCNLQRCIRTKDIIMVGDSEHHTFFEMLGNWSLEDYWKKDAIEYSFEFLTKILKIPKEKLAISIFAGNKNMPKDNEAKKIWENLKIPKERIINITNNWWGPTGKTGPCGPDTEIFYWKSKKLPIPKKFDPNNENWIEIWNNVFMQYEKTKDGKYKEAKQKNIDTGMGVERTITILNGLEDNYLTNIWRPIIKKIEELSKEKYEGNEKINRSMRIIADHIKASVFLIADGIVPSNTEQGYILRRLIRRTIVQGRNLNLKNFSGKIAESVFEIYKDYKHLQKNKKQILDELKEEEEKFNKTLERGLKIAEKMAKNNITISGKNAFLLCQSYGIPIEVIKEIVSKWGSNVDEKEFQKELSKHQELSRTASAGKFKSGLADNSKATIKLHTAAHLLAQALRYTLKKPDLMQKGSNITPERLRFDFNFPRKLTEEEIKKIENLINEKIQEKLPIKKQEMTLKKAKEEKAMGSFESKYNEKVFVYSIGNFSKEICAGPHVKNTSNLGKFKIIKEKSSSAGIRRIKAILE